MDGPLLCTDRGLQRLNRGEEAAVELPGQPVTALAVEGRRQWALTDGTTLWRSEGEGQWEQVAALASGKATCLAATPAGLLVGTAEAHLLRLTDGGLQPVDSFEAVEGREAWYTPWGGPPDVRSISHSSSGTYVNVHVGGILRSTDGGQSWRPTIDIDADVHQVVADLASGLVLAATARGLAVSADGGESWTFRQEGLHALYCRAVAVGEDTVLVSASAGPRGERAAVYRQPLGGGTPLERCREGLPEWFAGNIDTFCLAAAGRTAALATAEGDVFASEDGGRSWDVLAKGVGRIRGLALS